MTSLWQSAKERAEAVPVEKANVNARRDALLAALREAATALAADGFRNDTPNVDGWVLAGGPDGGLLALERSGRPLAQRGREWVDTDSVEDLDKLLERAADMHVHGPLV